MGFEDKINIIYEILVEKEQKSSTTNNSHERIIKIIPEKRYHLKFISEFLQMKPSEIVAKIQPINDARPSYFSGKSVIFLMTEGKTPTVKDERKEHQKQSKKQEKQTSKMFFNSKLEEQFEELKKLNNV